MIYETVGKPDIKAKFTDFQVTAGKGHHEICPHPRPMPGRPTSARKRARLPFKNGQGQEVAKVDIPDTPVLPGATRDIEISEGLKLPPGSGPG